MPRYIKNVARIAASLGPTEERGLRVWVGYETDGELEETESLKRVDGWSEEQLAAYGVRSFLRVAPETVGTPRR